jgi:hypothetical protein
MGGGQREEEGRLRQGGQEIAGAEGDAGAAAAAKSRPAINRAVKEKRTPVGGLSEGGEWGRHPINAGAVGWFQEDAHS